MFCLTCTIDPCRDDVLSERYSQSLSKYVLFQRYNQSFSNYFLFQGYNPSLSKRYFVSEVTISRLPPHPPTPKSFVRDVQLILLEARFVRETITTGICFYYFQPQVPVPTTVGGRIHRLLPAFTNSPDEPTHLLLSRLPREEHHERVQPPLH